MFPVGASAGGVGVGRQRLSQAGGEVGGSGPAVLWSIGEDCQLPGWGVFWPTWGPGGRALVDKRLYLPEEWTGDGERCATAGVPANRREYQSKTELALDMLECAQARGHLSAQWVAGDSRFRDVADAAGGPGVCGNVLRFGRASGYDGVAAGTDLDRSALPG